VQKVHSIRNEDGTVEKKVVEALRTRRKTKRSYEYEVKWLNKGEDTHTHTHTHTHTCVNIQGESPIYTDAYTHYLYTDALHTHTHTHTHTISACAGEDHNTYISREKLEEMGWGKMVQVLSLLALLVQRLKS
jgi:hypothetical protein